MTKQENNKKRYSALLKRIAKIAAVVLAVFVLCFGLAFGYLYTHQDKIKQIITNNLNAQLNTQVSVGGIEIDFFSKFPEVSIKFTNVRADEALPKSEQSLFLFKGIFVRFGIWDLLGEDYTVRKLSFDDGELNLRITPDGKVNFIFWKENEDDGSAAPTTIALENVEFNNAKLRYLDEDIDLRLIVFINHLEITGGYQAAVFESTISGKGILADLTFEDYDLADSLSIATHGSLTNQHGSTKINIKELLLQDVAFTGSGELRENTQRWKLSSKDTRLHQWLRIIPKAWQPNIDLAAIGGEADAQFDISLDDDKQEVLATAKLKDAALNLEEKHILLQNANGEIAFRYATTAKQSKSHLSLKNIKANTRTGDLALNLEIENLQMPQVATNGSFNIQLEELLGIARPGLLKDARGIVNGNFSYSKNFSDWDDLKQNFLNEAKLGGELALANGEMTFLNSNITLKNMGAEIKLRDKDLIIERFFAREGDSEFLLDGWLYNALYFGSNRPTALLKARLQSQYVDLDRILAWQFPRYSETDSSYTSSRTAPPAFNYSILLDVKRFNLIEFDGLNLSGEVWNDALKVKGKEIEFDALDGKVAGSFSWSTEASGYRFWTKGDLTRIDIHKLFNSFKNFGQEWLLAENIYGTGTASIETSMDFDLKMNFIPSSLKLISDISIEKGRLKGYKPLLSLSSIVEKKALDDVSFDKLQNQIAINNEVITIPQMEIKSSALNLLLQGKHSFDQQIDYSVRLALKDVLNKKRKDKKTDLDEWIVEVESADQPYIWIHIGCTIDDPCLTPDREMIKKGVKKEWKQQGEDIRNIFKPEPANAEPKKDPTKGEVLYEWNEEEPDTTKR